MPQDVSLPPIQQWIEARKHRARLACRERSRRKLAAMHAAAGNCIFGIWQQIRAAVRFIAGRRTFHR